MRDETPTHTDDTLTHEEYKTALTAALEIIRAAVKNKTLSPTDNQHSIDLFLKIFMPPSEVDKLSTLLSEDTATQKLAYLVKFINKKDFAFGKPAAKSGFVEVIIEGLTREHNKLINFSGSREKADYETVTGNDAILTVLNDAATEAFKKLGHRYNVMYAPLLPFATTVGRVL